MFKLFVGDILIDCIFYQLLKLSCRLISGFCGIFELFGMSWGILLCRHGSHCNYRILCCRLLLGFVVNVLFKLFIGNIFIVFFFNCMLELFFGDISDIHGIHFLFGVPRRILLRHNRSHCCYRNMRCG